MNNCIISTIRNLSKCLHARQSLQVWPPVSQAQINSGNTAHCIVLRKIGPFFFFFFTKYVLWIAGMTSQAHGLVFLCSLRIIYCMLVVAGLLLVKRLFMCVGASRCVCRLMHPQSQSGLFIFCCHLSQQHFSCLTLHYSFPAQNIPTNLKLQSDSIRCFIVLNTNLQL